MAAETCETDPPAAQPWTFWRIFLVAPFRPATSAKHTAQHSLRYAFLVHLTAALLLVGCGTAIDCIIYANENTSIAEYIIEITREVVHELEKDPGEVSLQLAGIILAVEVAYLLTALLLMAWGAADEPIIKSYQNALRQLWIRTPHTIWVLILYALIGVPVIQAWESWWRGESHWLSRSGRSDYRPWIVEHGQTVVFLWLTMLGTWLIWSTFRAIGGDRGVVPVERPPACEQCGYNLTAAPMDGRCPECGLAVEESLGSHVRCGPTPWQGPRNGGGPSFLDMLVEPFGGLRKLGRQIRTRSRVTSHRSLLAQSFVPVSIIGIAGLYFYGMVTEDPVWDEGYDDWLISTVISGVLSCLLVLGLACLAASLVGLFYRLSDRRNLLPGAMQAACYLAGYLILWHLFSMVWGSVTAGLEDWFEDLEEVFYLEARVLTCLFWFLPNLFLFGVYTYLVARVTAGTRYANR